MSKTRIYVVTDNSDATQRLVEATNKSAAIRHAVQERYSAIAATSHDVARLMAAGKTLEHAGQETD